MSDTIIIVKGQRDYVGGGGGGSVGSDGGGGDDPILTIIALIVIGVLCLLGIAVGKFIIAHLTVILVIAFVAFILFVMFLAAQENENVSKANRRPND